MIPHNNLWNKVIPTALLLVALAGSALAAYGEVFRRREAFWAGLIATFGSCITFKTIYALTRRHDGRSSH